MSVLRRTIPAKTVVLTFDDGSISQLRNVGPLLKELGFAATFFITEGLKIPEDKLLPPEERTFMTWPVRACSMIPHPAVPCHRPPTHTHHHTHTHTDHTPSHISLRELLLVGGGHRR